MLNLQAWPTQEDSESYGLCLLMVLMLYNNYYKTLIQYNLHVLMEETDTDTFTSVLHKTTVQLVQSDKTKEFSKYIETYYRKRAEQWAASHRRAAYINTNMYVESFHPTFK